MPVSPHYVQAERWGERVYNYGLYLPTVCARDSLHKVRLCDCVFERVGECDCKSGSAKRICTWAAAVSSLLLLVHLNRQRGATASPWKVCSVTARGRHPLPSSLITAHQKAALWCLYVP